MAVPFSVLPAGIRVPFFYAEVDSSQAGSEDVVERGMILAPMLSTGSGTAGVPYRIGTFADAVALFGAGSIAAAMVDKFRQNDAFGELWVIGVADPSGSQSAGSFTVTGTTASEAGEIAFYIGGYRLAVPIAIGDDPTAVAAALDALITADTGLPVTGSPALGVETLTAKHDGTIGDEIDLRVSFQAGEEIPTGLGVTVTPMAAGAGAHSLTTAIAALGDELYDWIVHPFEDTTNLDDLDDELDGSLTGRWGPIRALYSSAFYAKRGTQGTLSTFGATRNGPHAHCFGYPDSPSSPWEVVAAAVGAFTESIRALPSRPLQTLPVRGIWAPAPADRFTVAERDQLLNDGIATLSQTAAGEVVIERVISNYQTDTSWLDYNTAATLALVLRELDEEISTTFGRHVLINDGERVNPGLPVVTPLAARAVIIAKYREQVRRALVENTAAFSEFLIVERSSSDPNRIDVLYPPDLANQCRIFAALAQFRLQLAIPA